MLFEGGIAVGLGGRPWGNSAAERRAALRGGADALIGHRRTFADFAPNNQGRATVGLWITWSDVTCPPKIGPVLAKNLGSPRGLVGSFPDATGYAARG